MRTKTMGKSSGKIDSLKSLRRQKSKINRKLKRCEVEIVEDYYELIHPFAKGNLVSFVGGEYNELPSPVSGVYKFVLNARRFVEIVKMGKSIYMDYKR